MINLNELSLKLHALSVLRDLLNDNVVKALLFFLDLSDEAELSDKIDGYSNFVSTLYLSDTDSLSLYIQKIVNESENTYVKSVGKGEIPSEILKASLCNDLKTLEAVSAITPSQLKTKLGAGINLPEWKTDAISLEKDYLKRIDSIEKYGYGIYAKYKMFYIGNDYSIIPVQNPDSTSLDDLIDYEREQQIILDNTRALLCGKPAANILLTGDAGTGKSSTIKAIANTLYDEGLRIIEVRKEQLHGIPQILDELTQNPLKFILFIDDLSFCSDDDNFSALKAILEGSVSAKSANVVIYATSNRRHLVKESFSDREGDDVHFNDTMQEILSLSERFGIQLTFNRPDKETYLDIVHNLARKNGIKYDEHKIDIAAERFVLKRGTRSARAAKQFIEGLLSGNDEDIL